MKWYELTGPEQHRARRLHEKLVGLGVRTSVSQVATHWGAVNAWAADGTSVRDLCRRCGWDLPGNDHYTQPGEILAAAIEEALAREAAARRPPDGRGMRVVHLAANLDVLRDAFMRVRDELAAMSTLRAQGMTRTIPAADIGEHRRPGQ
jgi:hypothetical protein